MKRERRTGPRALQNTSTDSKGATFVILIKYASASIRKERLSPTSKARREVSRNEFMEQGWVPDRVKGFCEINTRITAVSKSTRKNNWRFASLNCEFVHIYFFLTFPRICPSSPY